MHRLRAALACQLPAILGLLIAVLAHMERASGICSIGGCAEVFYSEYSELFGVPLELLAAAWFASIATISTIYALGVTQLSRIITALVIVGLAVVPPLVYIELFIIGSVCMYCTAMHVLIGVVAVAWFLTKRKLGGDTGHTGLPQA